MTPSWWFTRERVRALLPWNTLSQHDVGASYASGDGVPQDEQLAMKWFQRAAKRGHAESQYDLGLMFLYGEGVEGDASVGLRWLEKAAEQGERRAPSVLATVFSEGLCGVQKDPEAAARWKTVAGEG